MRQQAEPLVLKFFNGDILKTKQWMRAKHPLLGFLSPEDLISLGKTKKLLSHISSLLEGSIP